MVVIQVFPYLNACVITNVEDGVARDCNSALDDAVDSPFSGKVAALDRYYLGHEGKDWESPMLRIDAHKLAVIVQPHPVADNTF